MLDDVNLGFCNDYEKRVAIKKTIIAIDEEVKNSCTNKLENFLKYEKNKTIKILKTKLEYEQVRSHIKVINNR